MGSASSSAYGQTTTEMSGGNIGTPQSPWLWISIALSVVGLLIALPLLLRRNK
jgi:hypothetical protein